MENNLPRKRGDSPQMEKTCPVCGEVFLTVRKNRVYCSSACLEKAKNKARAKWHKKYPKKTRDNKELRSIVVEAEAAGLSYGMYVAGVKRREHEAD